MKLQNDQNGNRAKINKYKIEESESYFVVIDTLLCGEHGGEGE